MRLHSVLFLIFATACSATESPSPSIVEPSGPGELVRSGLERDLSPDVAEADRQALAAGNRAFALDLYGALQSSPGNLFFSPHSISIALAMAYAGARGYTAAAMAGTLHFDLADALLHPAFNDLDLTLAGRASEPSGDKDPCQLSVLNALYGQRGFPFEVPFLDTLAVNYGAGVRVMDFAAAPEPARQEINEWVEEVTHERIVELLPFGSISRLTRLVLVNAVYFLASWESQFDPEQTRPATFHAPSGDVEVPFMNGEVSAARYFAGEGFEAVELPYANPNLAMLILLPEAVSLEVFEAGLTGELLASVEAGLQSQPVQVSLPSFTIDGESISLKETLTALGMGPAFAGADFTGIYAQGGLEISDVLHQAFIKVSEQGTEAAAATAVIVDVSSVPIPSLAVRVDRPFVFALYDKPTGALLFLGRLTDPR